MILQVKGYQMLKLTLFWLTAWTKKMKKVSSLTNVSIIFFKNFCPNFRTFSNFTFRNKLVVATTTLFLKISAFLKKMMA